MNVRITSELTHNVCNHIQIMRDKEVRLNFGSGDYDKIFAVRGDCKDLEKLVWGEHLHLKQLMPTSWVKDIVSDYHPHVYMEVMANEAATEDLITIEKKHHGKMKIVLSKPSFFVPPRHSTGHEYKITEDKLSGKLKELYDIWNQYRELHAKWLKISHDIVTYLRSAKSLNSAIKSWTELRAFIPQSFLDRVDAKPERTAERKKAEESLASIDRNLAVTSATLVKLATT